MHDRDVYFYYLPLGWAIGVGGAAFVAAVSAAAWPAAGGKRLLWRIAGDRVSDCGGGAAGGAALRIDEPADAEFARYTIDWYALGVGGYHGWIGVGISYAAAGEPLRRAAARDLWAVICHLGGGYGRLGEARSITALRCIDRDCCLCAVGLHAVTD